MVASAVVAAIAVYAFQLVGGRVLGEVEFTPIANLWTIQFLVVTIVLFPIEQLTIRRLAMQPEHPLRHDLPLIAGAVGTTALVISAALFVWRDEFLDGEAIHALQAGLLIVGYGMFAFGRGRLAGMLDFRRYGFTTAAESMMRLTLGVVLLVAGAASVGLAWSMVVAPLVILAWQPFRHISSREEHISVERAGGFLATYVVANGASNIILAAGPLVVDALGASNAVVSQYFFTLILLRAPFTFAYSLIARVLAPMARLVSEGRSGELSRFVGIIVGTGAALSAAGGLVGRVVGPWTVALLFGEEFRPRSLVAALIVAGIGAAFSSLVLTQILVARGQTGRLAVAWLAALSGAAIAIAAATGTPDVRVAIGFLVGQGVALLGLAVATLRTGAPVTARELLP
jgi:O-antigen/teichoic acid export membrane protein